MAPSRSLLVSLSVIKSAEILPHGLITPHTYTDNAFHKPYDPKIYKKNKLNHKMQVPLRHTIPLRFRRTSLLFQITTKGKNRH